MLTVQQKAQCVLWLQEFKSATLVRRELRRVYGIKKGPALTSITNWRVRFLETGSINDRPRSGRPSTHEEHIELVRQAFKDDPSLSVRKASVKLGIPRSTVQKVIQKWYKS